MERLKAEHQAVKVAAGGVCDFLPGGGWHLRFDGLTVDRLRNDRDLMQAVPERLKKTLAEINPTGAFSLRGSLDLAGGAADAPIRSQWDFALGMQQAGLDYGDGRLENACGGLTLAGGCDGRTFYSRGELALDSVTFKDHQFTRVMGPLWIDNEQVLLGSWADRRQQEAAAVWPPRHAAIQAPDRRGLWRHRLRRRLGDAGSPAPLGPPCQPHRRPARPLGAENLSGRRNLQGRIMAALDLQGPASTRNTLKGHGASPSRRQRLRAAADDLDAQAAEHQPRMPTPSAAATSTSASRASTSTSTASISTATPSACWARAK